MTKAEFGSGQWDLLVIRFRTRSRQWKKLSLSRTWSGWWDSVLRTWPGQSKWDSVTVTISRSWSGKLISQNLVRVGGQSQCHQNLARMMEQSDGSQEPCLDDATSGEASLDDGTMSGEVGLDDGTMSAEVGQVDGTVSAKLSQSNGTMSLFSRTWTDWHSDSNRTLT